MINSFIHLEQVTFYDVPHGGTFLPNQLMEYGVKEIVNVKANRLLCPLNHLVSETTISRPLRSTSAARASRYKKSIAHGIRIRVVHAASRRLSSAIASKGAILSRKRMR